MPVSENVRVPVELDLEQAPDLTSPFIFAWSGSKEIFQVTFEVIARHPLRFAKTKVFVGMQKKGATWKAKFTFNGDVLTKDSFVAVTGDFESLQIIEVLDDSFVVTGKVPEKTGRFENTIRLEFSKKENLQPAELLITGIVNN